MAEDAVSLIKKFEGYKNKPYKDRNAMSIGYGHKLSLKERAKYSKGITEQEAEQLLNKDIQTATKHIDSTVKVKLAPNQKAALTSFVYNVGPKAFSDSTLLQHVNKGDHKSAESELNKWVFSNKKKLKGLVNRRKQESAVYAGSDNQVPASPESDF